MKRANCRRLVFTWSSAERFGRTSGLVWANGPDWPVWWIELGAAL